VSAVVIRLFPVSRAWFVSVIVHDLQDAHPRDLLWIDLAIRTHGQRVVIRLEHQPERMLEVNGVLTPAIRPQRVSSSRRDQEQIGKAIGRAKFGQPSS
jgi:hypothetical protein